MLNSKIKYLKYLGFMLFLSVLSIPTHVSAYSDNQSTCSHLFMSGRSYIGADMKTHTYVETCFYCGYERKESEPHTWTSVMFYTKIDDKKHEGELTCTVCKAKLTRTEPHKWISYSYHSYKEIDSEYHGKEATCSCLGCDAETLIDIEPHSWSFDYFEVDPKPNKDGIAVYTCYCGSYKKVKQGFDWNSEDAYDYIDWSPVIKNATKMKFKFKAPMNGYKLRVKIGKRTYKKTLSTSRKVSIKIKRPKVGQTIKIYLIKGGKTVYKDFDDVYLAKNVRKGMTQKQVMQTAYWGKPDSKSSSSGGWKYWNYNDGSYIGFKNGKVRFWYDADR